MNFQSNQPLPDLHFDISHLTFMVLIFVPPPFDTYKLPPLLFDRQTSSGSDPACLARSYHQYAHCKFFFLELRLLELRCSRAWLPRASLLRWGGGMVGNVARVLRGDFFFRL